MDEEFERHLDRCWMAYRDGEIDTCLGAAEAAVDRQPDSGQAWWALGCALERQGATGRSDRAFRRAANAANDPQAPPARVPWRRFVAAVEAAAEALPSALRQALEEVPLELADYTPPYLLEEHPTEIELLGLFEGPTRGDRADLMAIPDTGPRIHVFRRPHEHQCWSVRELTEEVRRTVHHEFGHYLGYGEAELDEFGLG